MSAGSNDLGMRKHAFLEGPGSACPPRPDRRHPVHRPPSERFNRSIIVFVTVCTAKRRKVLAAPEAHAAIVSGWNKASRWLVGRYVVMPDHIHFFCAPNDAEPPSLEKWIRFWKSLVTRAVGEHSNTLWQRDHWDRQLRCGESYDQKWEYVRSNPLRHGLVKRTDDWPYQGTLNELRW
jgi:putative transposase